MIEPTPLSDLFQIRARFRRSVHIQADYGSSDSLSGYVVTPLCRKVLQRLGQGLQPGEHERAWSITGPYGAGKSACALFAARILTHTRDEEAHRLLQAADPELHAQLCGQIPNLADGALLVVPVVGSREPLALVLMRGFRKALSSAVFRRPDLREVGAEVRSLCESLERGQFVRPAAVLETIERVTAALRSGRQPVGLFIILDEMGKLLEYAALNAGQSDIYLLQSLAEMAARSGEPPFGLVVILHQAFEHYAARLSPQEQLEWGKVRGRFQDVSFLARPEELLRLVGSAIERAGQLDGLTEAIRAQAARAEELDLAGRDIGRDKIVDLVRCCAPLHPTVSLVLPKLFRSHLAQNERSLFAFLSSGEPKGFQQFLQDTQWTGNGDCPFYRLDDLYDYVLASMGSVLYAQIQGKRWAEIEEALDRLPDRTGLWPRLVKTIGMLGLLGDQRRVKASRGVLAYALGDDAVSYEQVQVALERLCKWRIAVYRRHSDAYSLWEGSDVDLEERFQRAMARIDRGASLALPLAEHGSLQPYIAKRHLHATGTLRYFAPWVTTLDDLAETLKRPLGGADGAIVFVLGGEDKTPEETAEEARKGTTGLEGPRCQMLFFAIPKDTSGLRGALEEAMAWEWVERNTPELAGDRIARRELVGRQIDATERLNRICARCFGKAASFETALWVWAGKQRSFASAADLSAALSEACDRVYHRAPIMQNELVNRRSLSSAAAAARRKLIELMLAHGGDERLGIEGFPPELSMYRSVLERSGLHHRGADGWAFGPGKDGDPSHVNPLWESMASFLAATEERARPVSELFALLREPPYGVRDGLLPVFFTASMLCWVDEVALYENGTFVPEPGIAEYERVIKGPEQFSVQRYPLGTARNWLLGKYTALIPRLPKREEGASVLSAIRPLLVFAAHLPEYTKNTSALSPAARAVRDTIATEREPQRLLFDTLPKALDMEPISSEGDQLAAQAFFSALRKALLELQQGYDNLLAGIEAQFIAAMKLPMDLAAGREEIAQRAATLADRVADLRLKAFLQRLADSQLAKREWLESVAALVVRKPAKQWSDQDRERFGVELSDLAGQFRRLEEISLASQAALDAGDRGRAFRLGVTTASGEEWREIVHVQAEEEPAVQEVLSALEQALRQMGVSERIRLAAVAEMAKRALSKP